MDDPTILFGKASKLSQPAVLMGESKTFPSQVNTPLSNVSSSPYELALLSAISRLTEEVRLTREECAKTKLAVRAIVFFIAISVFFSLINK